MTKYSKNAKQKKRSRKKSQIVKKEFGNNLIYNLKKWDKYIDKCISKNSSRDLVGFMIQGYSNTYWVNLYFLKVLIFLRILRYSKRHPNTNVISEKPIKKTKDLYLTSLKELYLYLYGEEHDIVIVKDYNTLSAETIMTRDLDNMEYYNTLRDYTDFILEIFDTSERDRITYPFIISP